ncbi:MAG: hypothetical protein H6977_10385 [Gammaproteobacteria bacterium]|nr:hypothetical protein [Gammaproteobacteria bacterium]
MNLLEIIQAEYLSALAGGLGGVITAWLTQRILNKRGTFTYRVEHVRVGMSAEDAVFGHVEVTWNQNPVSNLFLSTVRLKNESMNDYENIVVRAYTSDTRILSEQTQILDSPNILEWSEGYRQQLQVPDGGEPNEHQWAVYYGQREYVVPVFNRGQGIQLAFLNNPHADNSPNIWLSIIQKGVRLKYQAPQPEIYGVAQPLAAFWGVVIGLIYAAVVVTTISEPAHIAGAVLVYGLVAQIPGAWAVKLYRRLRELIGG